MLLCLAATASADPEQPKALFSAGGQRASGGGVTVDASLGDVLSGISLDSGSGTVIEHGFWDGNVEQLLDAHGEPRPARAEFLGQAVPNPARAALAIEFGLSREGPVLLVVYDVAGRLVRELAGGTMRAGAYRAAWDLRSASGVKASAGVYFAFLSVGGRVVGSRRLAVLD